ncbi:copper resistance CopC/CopD family protein [Dactylosporangium sp. CS-033363]|uniref:copper resistance CopC/CopD family protein n=1 Tax=Dactylosporangium sp. CS-033363 TaxID=3239935 RepID=UPI003D91B8A0
MTNRRWSVPLAMLLGALAILVLPAAPASAHAELEQTAPVAGTVLQDLPGEVTLTFSEQVRLVADKIKVIAPDGSRADTGKPAVRDQELVIPLKSGGPRGTYLVSYRVISADSHPVSGGYSFSFGEVSNTPNADDAGSSVQTDGIVKAAMSVARFLGFAGLVLLVGPALILFALWPRRLSTRDPGRVAMAGAGLLAVSTILELYVEIPYTAGTTLFDVTGAATREVLGTPFGAAHLVRLGVVLATAILLRPVIAGRAGKFDQTMLVILGVVGLATWPISGHPSASPVPTLTVVADAAHLAAMSVWLGGLVMLFGFLLRRANTRELTAIVPVWSGWALFAITVLVLAGTAQALVEIGTLDALTGTTYGQIVIAKVALLAVVIAVAAYSRRLTNRRFTPVGQGVGDMSEMSGKGELTDREAARGEAARGEAARGEAARGEAARGEAARKGELADREAARKGVAREGAGFEEAAFEDEDEADWTYEDSEEHDATEDRDDADDGEDADDPDGEEDDEEDDEAEDADGREERHAERVHANVSSIHARQGSRNAGRNRDGGELHVRDGADVVELRRRGEVEGRHASAVDVAAPQIEQRDRKRLRTAVIVEVAIAVIVLALTSVLVQTSPARSGESDTPPGPFDTVVATSLLKLQVDISPATVGQNSIHLYAVKADGSGPQTVVEWKATAALPAKGIEPLTVPTLAVSDDHAVGQVSLVSPGTWEFKFTARVDDLNQTTVTVQVPVK